MKKFICTSIGVLLLSSFTFGQPDHLQPVKGVFDINPTSFSYYADIRSYLIDSIGQAALQYVEIPSWGPEQLLTIHKAVDGTFYINLRYPDQSIWYARSSVPNPDITVSNFAKNLPENDYVLIQQLIKSALEQMEMDISDTWRPDVSCYYFSIRTLGMPTGTIESPKDGTNMHELISIMDALIRLTKKEGTDQLELTDALRSKIIELSEILSIAGSH